jgi:hypothetical protein
MAVDDGDVVGGAPVSIIFVGSPYAANGVAYAVVDGAAAMTVVSAARTAGW